MEQKSLFDRNTFIVILICVGIWWAWQQYLEKKYPEMNKVPTTNQKVEGQSTQTNEKAPPSTQQKISSTSTVPSEVVHTPTSNEPEQFWNYEDGVMKATVSSYRGRISDVELKKFTGKDDKRVQILSHQDPGLILLNLEGENTDLTNLAYKINSVNQDTVELIGATSGLTIKKTLHFVREKYIVKANVEISGDTSKIQRLNIDVAQPAPPVPDDKSSTFLTPTSHVELQEYFFYHGNKSSREHVTPKDAVNKTFDQSQFAALGSRYFTTLIFNRANVLPEGRAFRGGNISMLRMSYPVLEHSGNVSTSFDLYTGPKALSELSQVDEAAEKVVDFGFFSWIAVPLLQLMKLFYGLLKNYGLAIIALTLLVRLITFPFTYMSLKSMKSMQRIQPQIQRLRETHKDNPAALNQEMIKLMRDNKVNPMGGCLPMLLQLPIFWALYQVLQNSIELYHSPFFGWIHDLSVRDPYYVLPILMGVSMFVQQKMTPNTMDPAQARVMLIMPVVFSFLMFSLPSGLTLYIFVSTLFGIVQQIFMNAKTQETSAKNVVVTVKH